MLNDADRKLIHDVKVTDAVRFNGAQGLIRARSITFSVGTQGPFTRTIDLVDYNQEKIDSLYALELAGLRAAGVKLETV